MNKNIDNLIKEELIKRGIDVGIEQVEITKNALLCKGFRIIRPNDLNVSPVVYYSSEESISAIADRITAVISQDLSKFDADAVLTKDFFRNHAYIACCKHNCTASNMVVSKQFLNLDIVIKIYVAIDEETVGNANVTKPMLDIIGLSVDDAFGIATENSHRTVTIRSMSDIIGAPTVADFSMDIMSCNQGIGGAAAIIFADVIKNWCMANDITDIFILPSSTEEMIIISNSAITAGELLKINKNITASAVDPLIALDSAVYRYSVSDNIVTIAAAEVIDDD